MKKRLENKLTTASQLLKTLIALQIVVLFTPHVCGLGATTDSEASNAPKASKSTQSNINVFYGKDTLPLGIRSRYVENINGLTIHILEAGYEAKNRPCILLLHGFPELAYSWRKVMLPLAKAGYHVVAPDQRGYGLTTGWNGDYDGDMDSFSLINVVRDALGLVSALGHESVEAVVGHDYGSPVAALCALIRPDVFRSTVLMSAPFGGLPQLPLNTANETSEGRAPPALTIHDELAALPHPRKHYQWYYTEREANDNMLNCPQGVHAFLRAYYHFKSADWKGNKPFKLTSWSAAELAKMPTYYIMDLDKGMAECVATEMPSPTTIEACKWLSDEELMVYSQEFEKTGFQGGLNWYRCGKDSKLSAQLQLFSGLTIDVPSCYIAGSNDWGIYQSPGSLERMKKTACTKLLSVNFVKGAGHWVQQEQPKEVVELLLRFLEQIKASK